MADFNIRVNCIAPGPIPTDLIRGVKEAQITEIIKDQIYPKISQSLMFVMSQNY